MYRCRTDTNPGPVWIKEDLSTSTSNTAKAIKT